jgi:hypothetical protein
MDEKKGQEPVFCAEPDLADLFPLYVNGNVTKGEREKIEEHLATCLCCREELQFFMELKRVGKEVFCDD